MVVVVVVMMVVVLVEMMIKPEKAVMEKGPFQKHC